MVIKSQSGTSLHNWDDIADVHLSVSGKSILATQRNNRFGSCLASYRLDSWAIGALDMLYAAIRDGEAAFEFPSDNEMQVNMEHRSSWGRTKQGRHGGS